MRAALEDLVDRAEGRRTVAVLGDMAELGSEAPAYHREIGKLAAELNVAALLAVGDLARYYLEGARGVTTTAWAGTAAEAVDAAADLVEPGDCVLVKGSRVVGLEAVAAALTGRPV
jgi:UDP-N-acetylmuramoyl-tripeptide--D-alanyl-D-alanine ligase